MSALGTSQTENEDSPIPTTSHDPAAITTQHLLTAILNELATARQSHLALEQKFQALTMESLNEGEPAFIVKPFKGDKKERTEEAVSTWIGL